MALMGKPILVLFITLMILFSGFSLASASTPPAKIVSGFVSNSLTRLMKWLWSLKATTKTAISDRPMMKFESGYEVETVFDGSKLGIEPYSVEVLPTGELLILDSANSNLYRISSSLSQYTRPRLVAGSAEGYSGHVDGKLREARLNHPKGVAVDDRGNMYVADTENLAIRKISDAGVTTIAGGKWGRVSGHVDGPSDEAKFSTDFDVVYVGSSCSLLVIDRGNRAIREIPLHFDDCAYQYDSGFLLGLALLLAAGLLGYILALFQRRVGSMVSSQNDAETMKANNSSSPYQKPLKSVRPPLIPTEDDMEKQEESFMGSLGKLFMNAGTCAAEIVGNILPGFKKKPAAMYHYQSLSDYQQAQLHANGWPSQESIEVPKDDVPPAIEPRTPTPKKTYAFMTKDAEKMQQQLRHSRVFSRGWDVGFQQQQQQQQKQKLQHRHQQHSSVSQTYYEQDFEKTNEIVFGAVKEQQVRREPHIKPTGYADSYNHQDIRYRMSYNQGY